MPQKRPEESVDDVYFNCRYQYVCDRVDKGVLLWKDQIQGRDGVEGLDSSYTISSGSGWVGVASSMESVIEVTVTNLSW